MIDQKHRVISLDYNLYKDTEKGELIESTVGREPLIFLTGVGHMLPDFESNVAHLNTGDSFSFGIVAENAYGKRMDEAIFELPNTTFFHEGKMIPDVKVGNTIGLQDQDGRPFPAKILAVNEDTVTVDINHPLAGQNLHFTGKIKEVREATKDEIAHGHVHGEGGHHH